MLVPNAGGYVRGEVRFPPRPVVQGVRFGAINDDRRSSYHCCLKSHSAPFADTVKAGTHRICLRGVLDASYSMISYLRPHVCQLVQGATLGSSSQGTSARRRSSAIASSMVAYS